MPTQYYRGVAKLHLKDQTGACEDLNRAASLGSGEAVALRDESGSDEERISVPR